MKQKTAKTVLGVLEWIENNNHHYGSWEDERGFFILKGHDAKLRIPHEIQMVAGVYYDAAVDIHDARMFRANRKGRAYIKRKR